MKQGIFRRRLPAPLDENEDTFENKLLEACESAYEDGISSVDIYDSLEFLSKRSTIAQRDKILNGSESEHKISFTSMIKYLSILVVVVLLYLTFSPYMSPVKIFEALKERSCLLPSHQILMEIVRPLADCNICPAKNGSPIIEFKRLPRVEEFHSIAYSSRPIIVRGGAKIPDDFNFSSLKRIFESEDGGVEAVGEECQFLPFRSPFNTLKEAFEKIQEGDTSIDPWYIGWSNCHPGVGGKLREIFPRPSFLPEDSESSVIDWIFIGSPGLGAAMHMDYVKRPSWQAQIRGRKVWTLRPPPECEAFCPSNITFTINPGDLLFLETNTWYHETLIEGSHLSISIGSEYD